jgi:hypothetical protein
MTTEPSHLASLRGALRRGAVAVLCVAAIAACDEDTGGAVELSWSLEAPDGQRIDKCNDVRVAGITLYWGEARLAENSATWPCAVGSAVTDFELPPGPTLLWVEPVCESEYRLLYRTYEAPAPVVRTLEKNELVTLNAVLITVQTDCSEACSCICGTSIDPAVCSGQDSPPNVDEASGSDADRGAGVHLVAPDRDAGRASGRASRAVDDRGLRHRRPHAILPSHGRRG